MATEIVKNIKIHVQSDGKLTLTNLETGLKKTDIAAENLNETLKDLKLTQDSIQKGMKGVSAASGGATATVLEAGRAISDSNYGIRGMANNLSQLATNFAFTTRAAGGLTAGLKALWSAMLGPIGIILAINTVLALWERYEMQSQKTTKAVDDLNKAMREATSAAEADIVQLQVYAESVKTAEKGTNEYTNALKELTDLGYSGAIDAIDEFISKQMELILVTAESKVFEEEYTSLLNDRKLATQAVDEANTNLAKAQQASADLEQRIIDDYKTYGQTAGEQRVFLAEKEAQATIAVAEATEARGRVFDRINKKGEQWEETLKRILQLTNPKTKGGSGGSANKAFRQRFLDLQKIIEGNNSKAAELIIEGEKAIQDIQEESAVRQIGIQLAKFKTQEDARLVAFLKSKASNKAKIEAEKLHADTLVKAEAEALEAVASVRTLYRAKDIEEQRKYEEDLFEVRGEVALQEIENRKLFWMKYNEVEYNERQAVLENNRQRAIEEAEEQGLSDTQRLERLKLVYDSEQALRELDLEREFAHIDQKRAVNEEYMSWIAGTGDVLQTLFQKQTALAKAGLILSKGAAIADIVIKTDANIAKMNADAAGANVSAARNLSAAGGYLNPVAVAAFGKEVFATNTALASGVTRAKVSGGVAIAKILAQTVSSFSKPSGSATGGGGAAGGGRTFDFNLVGSTGENQLAAAVASNFSQPLRAYVLNQDVQDQAELDLLIEDSASIGQDDD